MMPIEDKCTHFKEAVSYLMHWIYFRIKIGESSGLTWQNSEPEEIDWIQVKEAWDHSR